MKKEWKHPFWETAAKDRLTARLNITHDDGSFTTSVARVSKFDENGKLSPDWEEILEQNSISDIDKFTEDRLERHRQKREAEIKRQEERNEAKRLEDLFNYKLQTFEIPEIKNSKNRKLKSKIRKAKNVIELNAYATILLTEIMNEAEQQEESK
jgi:hypothetical protein